MRYDKSQIYRHPQQSFNYFENNICNYLKERNILFFKGKYFYKKNKWFEIDIYIPNMDLSIECQGPRHFKKVSPRRIFIDNLKKHIFGKKLLCIHYKEPNKIEILKNFLFQFNLTT